MGIGRTRPEAWSDQDTDIAVETHCLTKAGRHGSTMDEARVRAPPLPVHSQPQEVAIGSGAGVRPAPEAPGLTTTMQIIERLRDLLDEHPDAVLDEYVEVEARMCTYVVAFDAAVRVKRELDLFPQPEWIEFMDQFGAKQCVRSQDIYRISESTPRTRAAMRTFVRARQKEEKADEQPLDA
jgi:hypothetical protein